MYMNSLNVTNKMQLLKNFIIITALHGSGTSRPLSGAYGNCRCNLYVAPTVSVSS